MSEKKNMEANLQHSLVVVLSKMFVPFKVNISTVKISYLCEISSSKNIIL